ncbi:MAG: hypothetical protein EAZ95_13370 [Bacteroidetes bacterium]|nr:MAG: hypothetical protein EAZ95_13370 [Bacteroidota bacterium]
MKYGIVCWLCCCWATAFAQTEVRGVFLQDSIEIGLPVRYALVARHAPETQLTFPDSAYSFAPFTFLQKRFFPTRTVGKWSVDSVVYELQSFDIARSQKLSLPVFLQTDSDTIKELFAQPDSVILRELVKGDITRQLPKVMVTLQPIPQEFNYPYLIGGIILIFMLSLPIWWLFGGRIIRTYRLFQFRTRHAIFLQEFNRLANRIISRKAIADIERALAIWKKHLEQIEGKPYSSYTSKEISQLLKNSALLESLKTIDRAVYGQDISNTIEVDLAVLRNISIERYEFKQEQMRYVDKVLE